MTRGKSAAILKLKPLLDELVDRFNSPAFIADDPVSIPHRFTSKHDIEIAGLLAATIAWGQRKTIIQSCKTLMSLMDEAPHDFVMHHQARDLRQMEKFVHRTFNATDLLYFISFLNHHYRASASLETLFAVPAGATTVEEGLIRFHESFFSLPDYPARTRKHVATPLRHSACKRLNMFLRWMVRRDDKGVDFGIWKTISPRQLICPCDVHVERVARKLKLLRRKTLDWNAALELTENLRLLDPHDPVKYDYALFGMGITDAVPRLVAGGR